MTARDKDLPQRVRALEAEKEELKAEVERLRDENKRWARMAGTDSLTGLPNKISFMRAMLPQTLKRSAKDGDPVGIVLLSADELGEINETHGREAGDQVIQGLGELLRSLLGEEDRVAHVDGTHFSVVVYPGDLDTVRGRANMLRARVKAHFFPCGDSTKQITVSSGVASIRAKEGADDRATAEDVFHHLNRVLYSAKKAGGNRVETVDEKDLEKKEQS